MTDNQTGQTPVVGAISGRLKGRIRSKPYTIVVTDDQTIFARTTSAMRKEAVSAARSGAKVSGAGRLAQASAQMGASMTFHERYLEMDIDDILAEHEKNHAIANSAISRVKLTPPKTISDNDGRFYEEEPLLKLKTPGKTYKFRLDSHMDYGETKRLLDTVYHL